MGGCCQPMEYGSFDESWCQRMGNSIFSSVCGACLFPFILLAIMGNEYHFELKTETYKLIDDAKVMYNCMPSQSAVGKLVFASGCDVDAPEVVHHLPSFLRERFPERHGSEVKWTSEIYQYTERSEQVKDNPSCHEGKTSTGGYHHCTYHEEWYVEGPSWQSERVHLRHAYAGGYEAEARENQRGCTPSSDGHYTVPDYHVTLGPLASTSGESSTSVAIDEYMAGEFHSATVEPTEIESGNVEAGHGYGQSCAFTNNMHLYRHGGRLYTSDDYERVGTVRFTIEAKTARDATFVGKLKNCDDCPTGSEYKVVPYPPQIFDIWGYIIPGRKTIQLEELKPNKGRHVEKEDLEKELQSELSVTTWLIRFALLVSMCLVIGCILQPFSVAADLLKMMDFFTCCMGTLLDQCIQISLSLAICCTSCLCFIWWWAFSWVFVRPTLGLPLMICSCGICCGLGAVVYYMNPLGKDAKAREVGPVRTPFMRLGDDPSGEGEESRKVKRGFRFGVKRAAVQPTVTVV